MKADKTERKGTVEDLRKEFNIPVLPVAEKPVPKPASVLYEEFTQKLINLVNQAGLPMFCLVPVLDDVLRQTRAAAENEYRHDFQEWQNKFKREIAPAEGEKTEDKT